MLLSEQHAEVEARLQELGWRLKPIDDAVKALRDLEAYIRADKVGAGTFPSLSLLIYSARSENTNVGQLT